MRVLYVADIVSPHQLPMSRCLVSELGESSFRYVATIPLQKKRVQLGWNAAEPEPWILRAGENETHRSQLEQWWNEADVVLCGTRRVVRFADRLRSRKLTFYLSERWWTPPIGMARLLHPRFAWMATRFCRLAPSPWFHYLPIGVYAASDMERLTAFHGRMWNWGHFTTLSEPLSPCIERNETLRVLWAGRMDSGKRVDTLIRAFGLLRRQNLKSRLTLIGDGRCREKLERLVRELGVSDHVDFHPFMPVSQVRQHMRDNHVYVFPSNAYEGWGAVLNEAMSEGCAVVASEAAGSAKTMLRHGENGLLFTPGDWKQLGSLLGQLSADEPLRRRLAEAGQRTIVECWSPSVAAQRFLSACHALLSDRPIPIYPSGPMTPAWKR